MAELSSAHQNLAVLRSLWAPQHPGGPVPRPRWSAVVFRVSRCSFPDSIRRPPQPRAARQLHDRRGNQRV